MTQRWLTAQVQETQATGAHLGRQAQAGDIIQCCGSLGAGKTTFVQGFAHGLDVPDEEYVRSPTFTLVQEYQGRLPLYHFDFYRLTDVSEVYDLGFTDYLSATGVMIIEWADKFPTIFTMPRVEVHIRALLSEQRRIQVTAYGVSMLRYFHEVFHTVSCVHD